MHYGMTDERPLDRVYDTNCNLVEEIDSRNSNPCNGLFSCSPPPITNTGARIRGSPYVAPLLKRHQRNESVLMKRFHFTKVRVPPGS